MRWPPPSMRRLLDTDRQIVDALLAAAVYVATIEAGHRYRPDWWRPFDLMADLLCVLIIVPLAVRRRAPMTVLVVSSAGFAWYLSLGYPPSIAFWGPVLGLYTVAALRPAAMRAAAALLTAGVIAYSGTKARVLAMDIVAAQALLVPAVALALGIGANRLAERNERLAALGEQLRQQQREGERRAVAEERIRIARELHDVVAHHMAVISVQAGLARFAFVAEPQLAQAALETVASTAGESLEEMRRMLAVLRVTGDDGADDDASPEPAAGLDRLRELLDRVRAAGVPVTLVVLGEPRPLSQGQDQCVFRVVQEALTNVLKHAGPATVTVTLHYTAQQFSARIDDDGVGAAPRRSDAAPVGHGLMGMHERARIYGGSLTAGNRTEGGFAVVLTLPTDQRGEP